MAIGGRSKARWDWESKAMSFLAMKDKSSLEADDLWRELADTFPLLHASEKEALQEAYDRNYAVLIYELRRYNYEATKMINARASKPFMI